MNWLRKRWPIVLLLVIAAVVVARSPYSAGNLDLQPDTVEYAIAPLQLLETGRYEIAVQDHALPPRYPPWFSVLVILPAYLLFGHDPGNSILPVTALAVAGVGFAYAIGRRIGGETSGLLSAIAVLLLPTYNSWATQPMTDVPCATLVLATSLLYLRIRAAPRASLYLFAGFLVAVAMLLRPVSAAMLLPLGYAVLRQRASKHFAPLLLPVVAAVAVSAIYNARTFGSPLRNGYNLWIPVPMDYPWLVFSLEYIGRNSHALITTAFPLLVIAAIVAGIAAHRFVPDAYRRCAPVLGETATFMFLTSVPISLFHLVYFYASERFHLPLLVALGVITGSLLGLLAQRFAKLIRWSLIPLLVIAIAARLAVGETVPHRRLAAQRIRRFTPGNAVIISAIDPVYLQYMAARGTARRIVPLSRQVEYASKLLAWKRIKPEPPPRSWRDTRAEALLRGGAEEAVKFVATEQLDGITADIAQGVPVFIDTTFADTANSPAIAELRRRFAFTPAGPELYQLNLR